MLITDTIRQNALNHPTKIAIQMCEEKITYQDFNNSVENTANFFLSHSFKGKQGRVGLFLPNSIAFLQYFFGAIAAGWIAVPFDPKWKANERQERLSQGDLDLIITTEKLKNQIDLGNGIVILDLEIKSAQFENTKHSVDSINEESLFYMGFTSGSTGKPKCFVRSHRSWVKSFDCSEKEFGFSEKDIVLIPGPLVHSLFLYAAVSTLFLGGTVKLLQKFSARKMLTEIKAGCLTALYAVPTMLAALASEIEKSDPQSSSLKKIISSGAKWEPGLKSRINALFPETELIEFYGASELSFVSYINHTKTEFKPLSVGCPFHNVQLSIRDEEGKEVGYGEIGTLYVKSEMLFSFYLNRPDANREVWDDNDWLTVGDLAKLDQDNHLYIIGRKNNMMITGGQNVYPEEIENILHSMIGIDEAVVFGDKDAYWGEKVLAAVKLQNGFALTQQEIQRYCREHLSVYKVPRQILFTEQFPYTESGKIARAKIKDYYDQGVFKE
ncbi:AMP-binding protein [Fictibacillus barbaricus]|uniref:Long-chain acyl-CoA synthetase n=1 Tax=Fictibacillus barbaricus TaxID=182136 RepID=A0ABU1U1S9_9BACL|nr:AMP-binding protein [Fictibacillus barbaricus]MDR7073413.1 long-chain acyl-CoA synthetase [Fictibacillus barbaricus]